MALTAGSVTSYSLDARGNATFVGTGGAILVANSLAASMLAASGFPSSNPLPLVGSTSAPYSAAAPATAALIATATAQLKGVYNVVQGIANGISPGLASWITANAVVAVPAAGINDSTAHACTGAASGTIS